MSQFTLANIVSIFFFKSVVNAWACSKEGEVMLIDGPDEQEGRVEICLDGRWGTIYLRLELDNS